MCICQGRGICPLQAIQESLQLSLPQYVYTSFNLYHQLTAALYLDGWVRHAFKELKVAKLIVNFCWFADRKVG